MGKSKKRSKLTKEQIRKKIERLKHHRSANAYRRTRMFPGPGIDEEEARLNKEIAKWEKRLNE